MAASALVCFLRASFFFLLLSRELAFDFWKTTRAAKRCRCENNATTKWHQVFYVPILGNYNTSGIQIWWWWQHIWTNKFQHEKKDISTYMYLFFSSSSAYSPRRFSRRENTHACALAARVSKIYKTNSDVCVCAFYWQNQLIQGNRTYLPTAVEAVYTHKTMRKMLFSIACCLSFTSTRTTTVWWQSSIKLKQKQIE